MLATKSEHNHKRCTWWTWTDCTIRRIHQTTTTNANERLPEMLRSSHNAVLQQQNPRCLFVLRLLVREPLPRAISHTPSALLTPSLYSTSYSPQDHHLRRKFSQLVSHHILRYQDVVIRLPIVHLKLQPHEIRQDGRGPRLRFDGWRALAWLGTDDGEAVSRCMLGDVCVGVVWELGRRGGLRDDVGTWSGLLVSGGF